MTRCTLDMWKELAVFVAALPSWHRADSREAVCRDWFGSGLYGGYRLTEWAQSQGSFALSKPLRDIFLDPRAFCLQDVQFSSQHRIPITHADALAHRVLVMRASICYRTHKKIW
jgi:hypothetical protein